jgi:hypothetical protein
MKITVKELRSRFAVPVRTRPVPNRLRLLADQASARGDEELSMALHALARLDEQREAQR